MQGDAILRVAYVEGTPTYWLTESDELASIPIPDMEREAVPESLLVTPCQPGLLRRTRRASARGPQFMLKTRDGTANPVPHIDSGPQLPAGQLSYGGA